MTLAGMSMKCKARTAKQKAAFGKAAFCEVVEVAEIESASESVSESGSTAHSQRYL